jgi:nucleotide-binding universal stress UspA family protein
MSKSGNTGVKRILVGMDASNDALNALQLAIKFSKADGSELILFHVKELPVSLDSSGEIQVESGAEEEEETRRIAKALDGAVQLAKKAGTPARKVVADHKKSVGQTIADYAEAENVGLIVVGTRGMGAIKRKLVGSVASELAQHAPCSVLLVR